MEYTILDHAGFYGPLLTALINIYNVWFRKPYLYAYIVGFLINTALNKMLKSTIREPRPKNPIFINKNLELNKNEEAYGMPSGHAQSVSFSIMYLYYFNNSYLFIISCSIGILTIYQRYNFRRHTLTQLFVGSLIGIIFANIVHNITKYYLDTQTKKKCNTSI